MTLAILQDCSCPGVGDEVVVLLHDQSVRTRVMSDDGVTLPSEIVRPASLVQHEVCVVLQVEVILAVGADELLPLQEGLSAEKSVSPVSASSTSLASS